MKKKARPQVLVCFSFNQGFGVLFQHLKSTRLHQNRIVNWASLSQKGLEKKNKMAMGEKESWVIFSFNQNQGLGVPFC